MVILATILVQIFRKLLYSGTKSTSSRHMSDTFGSSKKCMSCFFIKSCLKESDSNDNLYVIGFAICMGSGVRFLHKWTGLQHSCHRMTVYHQSWTAIHFPPSLLHPQGIPSAVLHTCVYTPTCQRKICSSPDHRHTQIRCHFPGHSLDDFKHCWLTRILESYKQYVFCSTTQRSSIVDLCYGTVSCAYKALRLPSFGVSYHTAFSWYRCIRLCWWFTPVVKIIKC